MLLGDVLAKLEDETIAAETIVELGDLVLIASLRERAEANGQSLGAYASAAMGRYTADASNEEWLALMGALGRAENPGAVCLKRALSYDLREGDR